MNFITNDKTGVSEGFCLIKTCDKKQTARGVPYLDLVLADQSGEISAKLWDYKEERREPLPQTTLLRCAAELTFTTALISYASTGFARSSPLITFR